MNHKEIAPSECANTIAKALTKGILLTTKAEGKVNTMVIGWGQLGTLWGKPSFTVFVRTSRETRRLLDANPEFTINVPVEGVLDKEVFRLAGTKSGRDHDKISELGLTAIAGRKVSVPALVEMPLTLECKVVFRHEMDKALFPKEALASFYPADVTDPDTGANCYTHVAYVGEVCDCYVLEA